MSLAAQGLRKESSSAGHIFLIEDDDALRNSIFEILSFVGYHVYSYGDPKAFLENLVELIPAAVVSDIRMPGMSGVELQAQLLKQGRKIPFVFISGESTVPQAITAMKQGAIEFLVKPFSRESLLAAVARAIELDMQKMRAVVKLAEFEQKLAALSPRERQVYGLLAKGYSNNELVNELGVALSTVKEYKSEMMYKLRLRSLSELIALNGAVEKNISLAEASSIRS